MKNLKVVKCRHIDFDSNIIGHCIDADKENLYLLEKGFVLNQTRLQDSDAKLGQIDTKIDVNSLELSNLDLCDIRLVEFIVESGSILIATKYGCLIRIGVSSFSAPSECIYKHNRAISSVRVSPDQDLIVLADEDNEIHMMSIDGHLVVSENAILQNESLHKPVGVGWGSKETQFFGLDGRPSKESRDKDEHILAPERLKSIEQIEASDLFKKFRHDQERSTVVDWRGDGQYIATLTYLPDSQKHRLKVWNRNLELQYMSEQLVTIERGMISWIPNGQYVCCTQRRNQQICDIVMFEKNGMIHQRVSLPTMLDDIYIKDMIWSPDSKILALVVVQFGIDADLKTYCKPMLMFYTMQNFHYYLKWSTSLSTGMEYLLRWNPNNYNRLHVISSTGVYFELDCEFVVNRSNKFHNVAVIDGCKLLLTPLEVCRIPPPMSAIEFDLGLPIYRLAIDNHHSNNLFILTLDNRLLHLYQDQNISEEQNKSLKVEFKNEKARQVGLGIILDEYPVEDVQDIQHILTTAVKNTIIIIRSSGTCSDLVEYELLQDSTVKYKKLMTIAGSQVLSHSNQGETGYHALVLSDKSVSLYHHPTNSLESAIDRQVLSTSLKSNQTLSVVHIVDIEHRHLLTLGQELSLKLHKGPSSETMISNSCTSFQVTENYLVFTTTDNLLHVVYLKNLFTSTAEAIDSVSQPIEVGATIITVNELDCQVVLQMPRGNLEIIHPRVLILASITSKLIRGDGFLNESFEIARRHRLDLNYIVDFLLRKEKVEQKNCIRTLVKELKPEQLCLLLTEISDCDTIKDRYKELMSQIPADGYLTLDMKESKISRICPDFEDFFKVEGSTDDHLEVRLLLHLKTKDCSEVAMYISKLDKSKQPRALKFVLYYVDIDELFSAALRTYDMDTALMVAGASNKDPKEYLALLDKFSKEFKRGFRHGTLAINLHLRDYDKALDDLIAMCILEICTDQELIDLVTSKKNFRYLLKRISHEDRLSNDFKGTIWSNYGDYLLVKRYHLEASVAFSIAFKLTRQEKYFASAFKCSMLVNNTQIPLSTIYLLEADSTLRDVSFKKIISKMEEEECFSDSIALQKPTFEFSEELKAGMIKAGSWYTLIYLSEGRYHGDICNAIREESYSLDHDLNLNLNKARDQFERLKYLLSTHLKQRHNTQNTEYFASDSLSTVDGSEISSISGSSGNVDRSSGTFSIKTRKTNDKEAAKAAIKKKRISTKKDTRYEDMALVLELKKFVSELERKQVEAVRHSVANYLFREYSEVAVSIERINYHINESLQFARDMIELLWPAGPHCDQTYSLYKRFAEVSLSAETHENVDFEVLIRPEEPNGSIIFELF